MSELEFYAKRLHEAGEAEQNHINRVKDCGGWPILEDRIRSIDPNDRQVGGKHYKGKAAQPWDVVDQGPVQHAIGYYRWNALKYIARAGEKGDFLEDIEKAHHYLEKLIHFIKNSGPKV